MGINSDMAARSLGQFPEECGVARRGLFEHAFKLGAPPGVSERLDDEPPALDGDLQRGVGVDVQQVHDRAVDDERGRVPLTCELLDHLGRLPCSYVHSTYVG